MVGSVSLVPVTTSELSLLGTGVVNCGGDSLFPDGITESDDVAGSSLVVGTESVELTAGSGSTQNYCSEYKCIMIISMCSVTYLFVIAVTGGVHCRILNF